MQAAGAQIKHCKCEVAIQVLQALQSHALIKREQHFSIGTGAECMIAEKLAAQFPVIVDLAIEDDDGLPVGAEHRLRTGSAEVDDAQPRVAEKDLPAGDRSQVLTVGVGSAMRKRTHHGRSVARSR